MKTLKTGLRREAEEEIGIKDFEPALAARYIWESDVEREYVFCFITKYNGELKPNKIELADAKFWSRKEIEEALGKGVFTPNFEHEFEKVFS